MIRHAPSIGLGLGLSLRSDTLGAPGLLDLYGGAAAAYSLRALSRGWLAGDVVEVRRSSDSATQSFTANEVANGTLEAWVGVGNDGFVSTWYDQSGNANDATQIATASQPKIVDAGALVTGGLDFDGVDDELDFDSAIDFSNGDWLLSAVVKWDGNSSPIVGGGGAQWSLRVTTATNFSARATNDSVIHNFTPSTNFASGTVALASIYRSSDVLYGSKDGTEVLANPAITSGDTFSADKIGRRGSAFNSSPIAEIIIYNTDQYANRAGIETNINDHYSIYA